MLIRAAVLGAGGRMGTEVCRAMAAESDIKLVAAVDPRKHGASLSDVAGIDSDVIVSGEPSALSDAGAEVAVDFTTPSSVVRNIEWCIEHSVHAVVGTTGIPVSDLEQLSRMSASSKSNVLIAPNFAVGAVLLMHFAQLAAKWLPAAEIVELHHPGKLDSPSGTSIRTAEAIAKGRSSPDSGGSGTAGTTETVPGARGAEAEGVRIHSVRLPGLVAHQEVIFGGRGQTLTLRHDSLDRSSFIPGVLLAIREVKKHRGLTVGLEKMLGL